MNEPRIRIQVVEDEAPIALMYRLKLEREGFEVRTASNGAEGLELAEAFRPHLILLDLRMPIMSGDEMLRRLRSEDWGGEPRVVVLTNISRSEAPSSLRFLSVDTYIVKAQSTPAQVVATIQQVLHVHAP